MTSHIATVAFMGIDCKPFRILLFPLLLCGSLAACSFTYVEATEEDIEEAAVAAMQHDYRRHGFKPIPDSRRCIRYYVGSANEKGRASDMRNFSLSSRKKLLEALGSALPDEQCQDPLPRNQSLFYCDYRKKAREVEREYGMEMGCGDFWGGTTYLVRKSFGTYHVVEHGGWSADYFPPEVYLKR